MKRTATLQIDQKILEAFAGIRTDIRRQMDKDITIENTRKLLELHTPSLVAGRAQVLLDSLLGYLMEDAIKALKDAPTSTKNEFYELEMRGRLKGSYTLEPKKIRFSFDPRFITRGVTAGVTLLAGGLIVGIVLSSLLGRVLVGLVTLFVSVLAFRFAHLFGNRFAKNALEKDLSKYLSDSENQVSNWLDEVDKEFGDAFDQFAKDHGMHVD